MKRSLLACGLAALSHVAAGSAMAADLEAPVYKAPPVPMAYNWSGCHVGIQGGGAWGTSKHTHHDSNPGVVGGFGLPLTNNFDVTGAVFGGTLGCDYQVNNWVIGVENDLSWTNMKGSSHLIPPFTPAANTFETNEKWLDTLPSTPWHRVGSPWFLYGTGGVAFSRIGIHLCSPLAVTCGSASHTSRAGLLGRALSTPSGTIGRSSSNISMSISAPLSSPRLGRRRLPAGLAISLREMLSSPATSCVLALTTNLIGSLPWRPDTDGRRRSPDVRLKPTESYGSRVVSTGVLQRSGSKPEKILRSAGRPARSRGCKSLAMKE